MSDVLIVALAVVATWAAYLLFTYRYRLAQLALEERRTVRLEDRAQLESGVTAIVEAARKEMHDARVEMKTFLANNRRT